MANPPDSSKYPSANLTEWKKQPPLKANYVRHLAPDGEIEDIWRGYLEGALEASDEPLQIFRSQKQWQEFLEEQRTIENHWSSRYAFTPYDRIFLERGRVAWLDDMMWSIYFNYENLDLTDEDKKFLQDAKIALPEPPADMTEAQDRANKRNAQSRRG